jgi:hypothetical protein
MDLRLESESILENSGYRVRESLEDLPMIYFEDSSLVGFISIEPSCQGLLKTWKTKQDAFLQNNAQRFRSASYKAWNAYSVFLTDDTCSAEEKNELRLIEEDFRGTRKIAVANLVTREDLRRALYPLLPIQNLMSLQGRNASDLLFERLPLTESQKTAFLTDESAEQFVKHLIDEEYK